MIIEQIIMAIILGITGGIMPGPIIIMAFSEILKSPDKGLINGGKYVFVAGITEFFIGLFLILTSSWLKIPIIAFHTISLIGVAILFYISYQVYKIRSIEYKETKQKIGILPIIIIMLFNGPLWLFWLSVCLPASLKLGNLITHGEFVFLLIFEISVMFGLGLLLFGFNYFRKIFLNEKIISRIFTILSIVLFFIASKILYSEIIYFFLNE